MIMIFIGLSPIEGFFWRQYIVQVMWLDRLVWRGEFPSWFAPVSQDVLDSRIL